ncbi:hypothetical protein QNM99_02965 [Pseudomonas sp. PCH446]
MEAPLEFPIKRLKMGVPQLDEMLGGGLPRGYSLLVAGHQARVKASWRRPSWLKARAMAKPA